MARIEASSSGRVVIDDNVSIGQCFHLIAKEMVVIGRNTTISANVFISDVEHEYRQLGVHIMDQELLVSRTTIGQNSFIGYGAVIRAGTILGEQCIVGANAVVRGRFPDRCVIAGNPARIIKKYNLVTKCWEKI